MRQVDLLTQIPELYQSPPFAELQRVLGNLCRRAGKDLDFTLEQLWPQTASGWGLSLWEQAYGITPGAGESVAQRRVAVCTKIRADGFPTPEKIAQIASDFTGLSCWTVEHFGAYEFEIWISGCTSTDETALCAVINPVKPAHLAYAIKYELVLDECVFVGGVVQCAEIFTLEEVG